LNQNPFGEYAKVLTHIATTAVMIAVRITAMITGFSAMSILATVMLVHAEMDSKCST